MVTLAPWQEIVPCSECRVSRCDCVRELCNFFPRISIRPKFLLSLISFQVATDSEDGDTHRQESAALSDSDGLCSGMDSQTLEAPRLEDGHVAGSWGDEVDGASEGEPPVSTGNIGTEGNLHSLDSNMEVGASTPLDAVCMSADVCAEVKAGQSAPEVSAEELACSTEEGTVPLVSERQPEVNNSEPSSAESCVAAGTSILEGGAADHVDHIPDDLNPAVLVNSDAESTQSAEAPLVHANEAEEVLQALDWSQMRCRE